jgi:membrane protease YdiL (CAAX protease family)
MNAIPSLFKRHLLVLGIVLMFALTWPIDLANSGFLPFQVPFVVYIFLGWGFVVASLIMTGLTLGKDGVITLLRRFLIWRVGWKWYIAAFFLMPALQISAILLNAALTQITIDFNTAYAYQIFGPSANLILLIIPFFLFDAIANGEEIGWRGYVLPRLQSRYSALVSSLIVGAIWGFWHLPKFLPHWDGAVFSFFMVSIVARSVLYTWLFNSTKGSLLMTTLFHASGNTGGVLLPVATTAASGSLTISIIQAVLEVIVAAIVISKAGPERLSQTETKQKLDSLSEIEGARL